MLLKRKFNRKYTQSINILELDTKSGIVIKYVTKREIQIGIGY